MARIRSLKPEFWDDRKLARSTSRDARMLYMGMWNQADEHGRLNGDAAWLKGRVFAFEDDITAETIVALLDELERAGRIWQYEVDGDPFVYLPKLSKHQRLEAEKVESRLPDPPSEPRAVPDADKPAPRADDSAQDADKDALLYVAGSREQVAGVGDAPREPRSAKPKRGTRLKPDWKPSDEARAWTLERIDQATAAAELEKFRNYWLAKSGKDATKVDWDATWRNWVLNGHAARASPNGRSTTDDRVAQGRALAADLRAREKNTPKGITDGAQAHAG